MKHDAMVVSPQPEATEAGVEILRSGGNAADAAIACALVQGVVDPMMCGIAGFGSFGFWRPGDVRPAYIDFSAPAPLRASDTMWADRLDYETRDGFGFILNDRANELGYQAVCTPAALRGYHDAHSRYGRLPWAEIVSPAIAWAESGWPVRPAVYMFWTDPGETGLLPTVDRLSFSRDGRALYCREDGTPRQVGETIVNRDYAQVLRQIARDGADTFYKGEIAAAIAEDFARNDGLLDARDLASVASRPGTAVTGRFGAFDIASNRPPGGGVMLLQMLGVLDRLDLAGLGHNAADYIRIVSEVMKQSTVEKDKRLGDPLFVGDPTDDMLAPAHLDKMARWIRDGQRTQVPRRDRLTESPNTTHLCVTDSDGACVSMTHSLGIPSGVMTPGLGFMFNGCMSVFDPRPGRTGSVAPGKARFSSICPSFVFRDRQIRMVLGAPGGTQIAMGVLQVILNVLHFGMPVLDAVCAPRFSATGNAIDIANRIPRATSTALENAGYEVRRLAQSYAFARVHAICVDEIGQASGGADPATDGMALTA